MVKKVAGYIAKLSIILTFLFLVCNFLFIAQIQALVETTYYIHADQVGSTIAVTDQNGKNVTLSKYQPYGSTSVESSNAQSSERKYTGQIKDDNSGLYYYNARYYDSIISRFISADSTNDQQNRYAYVSGNPIMNNDPTGQLLTSDDDSPYAYRKAFDSNVTYDPESTKVEMDERTELTREKLATYNNPFYQVSRQYGDISWTSQLRPTDQGGTVGWKDCGVTTSYMLQQLMNKKLTNNLSYSDFVKIMQEKKYYNPSSGTTFDQLIQIYNEYNQDDSQMVEFSSSNIEKLKSVIDETGKPVQALVDVNYQAGRNSHLVLVLKIGYDGIVWIYDPYLDKTNMYSGMRSERNVLAVPKAVFQASFLRQGGGFVAVEQPNQSDSNIKTTNRGSRDRYME